MKEFNENDAIKAMSDALPENLRNEDALFEVFDLIYDYYDDNGYLEIDFDDQAEDENIDLDDLVDFISRHVRKNSAAKDFTRDDILNAVRAERAYEDSLIS